MLQKKSSVDLLKFYANGEYSEQNDVRNTAEVKGGGYYEHIIGERWSPAATGTRTPLS